MTSLPGSADADERGIRWEEQRKEGNPASRQRGGSVALTYPRERGDMGQMKPRKPKR